MRSLMLALVLAAGLVSTANSQGTEIEGVIGSQIKAFQADDFEGAFKFAHPNIRNIFRTPENFGRMVTRGYPMVWRPAEVTYLELREVEGDLWQKVRIVDGKGAVHLLDYRMRQTSDGWKISGVQLLEAAELSA